LVYIGLSCLALALPAGVRGQDAASTAATAAEAEEEMPAVNIRVVVVEAARPEWERELSLGTVDVVVPDDFKGEQKKLPEYLDRVPGLHVERRGGEGQYTTVTTRGSTAAQVGIYVDGVPQNLGVDFAIDLSLIPMDNVARIEVYRGYTPARFAGAPIGGVINIVTKRPRGFGFNISAGLKSFAGKSADATATAPLLGGSLLLGFHRDQSAGDFEYDYTVPVSDLPGCGIMTPCRRTRKSNSYKNTDMLVKWQDAHWYAKYAWKETSRFYPNETNKATQRKEESNIDADDELHGWQWRRYTTLHRYQKADQHDLLLGRRQTWKNLEWGLEANYTKQEKFYNMMDFIWSPDRFETAYVDRPGSVWNIYDTRRYGANLDGSYRLGERHLLEFRVDFSDEKLWMDGNQWRSLEAGGYNSGDGPVTYTRGTWHVQASDTVALNDRKDLRLTLIARWDKAQDETILNNYWFRDTDNADGVGTYGVALKKEIGDAWSFRGTGGSYVRYPNFYELYGDGVYVVPSMGGSRWSRPVRETGYQWDFGADWRGGLPGGRAALSATYFGRLTDNQIYPQYDPLNGTIQYTSAGVVKARGMEFEGKFRWSRFDLDASATWQETKVMKNRQFHTFLVEGEPLTLMPDWETYVRGSYRMLKGRLSLFAEHHYTGEMLENWRNESNINYSIIRLSQHVTGAGLRYRTPWGFTVVSGVDDLFNQRPGVKFHDVTRYSERLYAAAYPTPGRTWYVTLDYMLGRGSASDASGVGSTDSGATAGASPRFPAAGKPPEAGDGRVRKKFFYLAPKLVYTSQAAEMAGRDIMLGPGNIPANSSDRTIDHHYLAPEYTGPQMPFPGSGLQRDSWLGGGLALGVDLYERFNLPLRFEFEADMPEDNNIQGRLHPRWYTDEPSETPGVKSVAGDDNKIRYRTHTAFFNAYYDFHNSTRFTPYIGAGAGMSFVNTEGFTDVAINIRTSPSSGEIGPSIGDPRFWRDGVRERNFAWHAGGGVSYRLTGDIDLDVAYRYADTGFDGRKGPDLTAFWGAQLQGELYIATLTVQAPALDLRHRHQAVVALRFSF
jgi:outer membrane receptor protein involved in Fe transport